MKGLKFWIDKIIAGESDIPDDILEQIQDYSKLHDEVFNDAHYEAFENKPKRSFIEDMIHDFEKDYQENILKKGNYIKYRDRDIAYRKIKTSDGTYMECVKNISSYFDQCDFPYKDVSREIMAIPKVEKDVDENGDGEY